MSGAISLRPLYALVALTGKKPPLRSLGPTVFPIHSAAVKVAGA